MGINDGMRYPPIAILLLLVSEFFGIADLTAGEMTSTYVAFDFSSSRGWGPGGGPGNRLDSGRWEYAFNAGAGAPSLNTDFSLLGEPATLRLVLDGDGSGHSIHVQLASHFQRFHRQIGHLTGKGELVLEVPLGNMEAWKHFGGQNDGQVRLPLRMSQLRLDRTDAGPANGRIALKRIEIDTVLPEGLNLLLVPDIRHTEGRARFSVRVQNLRSSEVKGRLVCDIRNLGERVKREVVEMTVPPAGARQQTRAFGAVVGRHHFLEAVFQWVEPGSNSPPVSIGMSTLPAEPGSATLNPESPIGVGLYLYRWHRDPRAHERVTELAGLAQRAGVKWTREQIDWGLIEPSEGHYNWAFYDDLIDVALDHGISVYGLLCYWSPYAKANTPEGIDQYCRWVGRVVRRYKSKVKHWEIWNEPNIFFWSGPKELYATLLTRAYEAIKAEDPEAQVLGCSTSSIDTNFIKLTMARGGKFDALTIHPYRGTLEDLSYIQDLQKAKALVDGRPVWITEIGFPSQLLGGYCERRQASLVARVYLASVASGAAESVSWYDFRNDGTDPYYAEMNFGLVRSDFRLKPGYGALATIGRTLAGLRVTGQIDVGQGAYAFRFSDGERDTIAACAPDAGRVLTFETDADVGITNGMGEPIDPVRNGRRISITLDAGFPAYITSRAGFAFRTVAPAVSFEVEATSIRPGQAIELRFSPKVAVCKWDLPFGWSDPDKIGNGTYRLAIPLEAPAGQVELQATVHPGGDLRLPLILSIQPGAIRQ